MSPQQIRKICFVTGSRAEYGLLYWLMKAVDNDAELQMQLIVTGSHLEKAFGDTFQDIEADGFSIDCKVPLHINGDNPIAIADAMAKACSGITRAFSTLLPDLIILLGDRYEIFAAAQAALLARIPIAHIHGGELTEGAIDDAMRHAITKLSHLHFTAATAYQNRVIQLGENPDRVFLTGAIGLDNIDSLNLLSKKQLSKSIDMNLDVDFFLVTYHPETINDMPPKQAINELIAALDAFPNHKIIFTSVNADPGYRDIRECIETFTEDNKQRVRFYSSLGQIRYLSAMKHCAAVIGNSSSGILEAPAFPVPTVNIGDRQKGRLRAISIIDCTIQAEQIMTALTRALSADFKLQMVSVEYFYGQPGTSNRIHKIIRNYSFDHLLKKQFHDIFPTGVQP